MHIIGLTGQVASGKSTASSMFETKGVPVIDCDAIVHELQANDPELAEQLKRIFPKAFESGRLDRQVLSRIVLASSHTLKQLEELTMPYVRQEIETRIKNHRLLDTPLLVIDAPLLFSTGLNRLCDSTLLVYRSPKIQKERFMRRPGATKEKFNTIIKNQMPVEKLKELADDAFMSDNKENLENHINTLVRTLTSRSQRVGFYAGSFDPLTKGHWALICEAVCQYDKVYIGVGVNPDKKMLFTPFERAELAEKTISDFMDSYKFRSINKINFTPREQEAYEKLLKNPKLVQVISYDDATVDAAWRVGASALLRGERSAGDHEYENINTVMNQDLLKARNQAMSFVTLSPFNQQSITRISSSAAKGLCNIGEYIAAEEYVTPSVHEILMKKVLFNDFKSASEAFGITDADTIQKEYDTIVKAYSDVKKYHNLTHIARCLNYLKIYEAQCEKLKPEDKKAMVMAIFYHDTVQGENAEEESKKRAIAYTNSELVGELIDATNHLKDNKLAATPLQQLIADVDVAILGTTHLYSAYVQAVRQEYIHYPDSIFNPNRTEVLNSLLAKEQIFKTLFFQKRYGDAARENLSREREYWKAAEPERTCSNNRSALLNNTHP